MKEGETEHHVYKIQTASNPPPLDVCTNHLGRIREGNEMKENEKWSEDWSCMLCFSIPVRGVPQSTLSSFLMTIISLATERSGPVAPC